MPLEMLVAAIATLPAMLASSVASEYIDFHQLNRSQNRVCAGRGIASTQDNVLCLLDN